MPFNGTRAHEPAWCLGLLMCAVLHVCVLLYISRSVCHSSLHLQNFREELYVGEATKDGEELPPRPSTFFPRTLLAQSIMSQAAPCSSPSNSWAISPSPILFGDLLLLPDRRLREEDIGLLADEACSTYLGSLAFAVVGISSTSSAWPAGPPARFLSWSPSMRKFFLCRVPLSPK